MNSRFLIWPLLIVLISVLFFSSVMVILLISFFHSSQEQPSSVIANVIHVDTSEVSTAVASTDTPEQITFFGDVMLARSVELWMLDKGAAYPFVSVPAQIGRAHV